MDHPAELNGENLVNLNMENFVGTSFSSWKSLSKGVPQGSVLGPLLLNIFINDFFYAIEHSQICNFADDNTIFACSEILDEITKCIENDMRMAMNWFKQHEMVANPEKFQLIFLGLKEDHGLSIESNGDVKNAGCSKTNGYHY